jgi:hypothetical protein
MPPEAQIDYQQLATALLAQQAAQNGGTRRKAVSSTPTSYYGHGVTGPQPGGVAGLFTFPGLERPITNAMVMPRLGLLDLLPSRTSIYDNPLYGIMTGVTASSGSEPTGVCDDPPTAGLMKLCTHAFVWGRFSRMTRVFDIDRAGRFINRSDFNDLELVGNPLGPETQAGIIPSIPGNASAGLAVRSEIAKALFEFGTAWGRDFAPVLYDGSPANNTAGGGYKEPYGLDILINDGYRDAETGVACPAADSIVRTFGNLLIGRNGTDDANLAAVLELTYIYRNLRYNASRMGLAPAQWVIAMPWGLFYELTEIWPCAYSTYRCTVLGENNRGVVDIMEQNRMRDDMRGDVFSQTGQYLLIDGERVPVVLDDGIAETTGAGGVLSSGLYFVPLRILGQRPATFVEYVNYDGPMGAMEMAAAMAPAGSFYTTNGGRFLWHAKPPTNFCVQLLAKTEWRVILETPQIAARLTDVNYAPLIVNRSWDPANTSYYVDGGRTDRNGYGPSWFSPTA